MDMNLDGALAQSLHPFEGVAINSVADLKNRAESIMNQAKAIAEKGKNLPISFYIHTSTPHAMRFVPQLPKPVIAPALMMLCQTNPTVTGVVTLSEVWALKGKKDDLTIGTEEAREWVQSGRSIREHPDAVDAIMVAGVINVSGHGRYVCMGTCEIRDTLNGRETGEVEWLYDVSGEGAILPPQLDECLSVIEDPGFLREKQSQPKPGKFSDTASDW